MKLVSHPQWLGSSKLEGEKTGATVVHLCRGGALVPRWCINATVVHLCHGGAFVLWWCVLYRHECSFSPFLFKPERPAWISDRNLAVLSRERQERLVSQLLIFCTCSI